LPSAKDVEQALKPKQLIFGLTIHNIPTINLRLQYARDRKVVFTDGLTETLQAWRFNQTKGATVTYPYPDEYFTALLRSTIVGIECTLQAMAIQELGFSNRLTKELHDSIRNPGGLSRSMLDAHFNRIPAKIDPKFALKICKNDLWKTVCRFYSEIRNPLSHGYQLGNVTAESLRAVFGMFDEIYCWIDSWSDPNLIQNILSSTTLHRLK
jgi:hypothetical protein